MLFQNNTFLIVRFTMSPLFPFFDSDLSVGDINVAGVLMQLVGSGLNTTRATLYI